jgi:DnaJ family protein C protein 7
MSDWENLKEKGNDEYKKKNYNTAINLYTQAIEMNQKEETLYGNRALCFKAVNKLRQAMYDLNNALKLNPKSTKYLKRLAQIHILFGNFGDADILINKCCNLEPRDTSHITDLSNLKNLNKKYEGLIEAKQKSDWKKCEELAEPLIKECTEFTNAKILYIESLLNNVKLTEAIDFIINKVSSEEQANEEFDFLLATAFYYDGKYDKAKKVLATVLQKVNDNEKYNHLWKILKDIEKSKEKANDVFKNGKYQEAIELYTKLLEIDPNNKNFNSTIYANRALCYQKLGNNMEALKDINISINLNERYFKAYMRRGNIYMNLKMYEEAKYDFQKVKDAEPGNADANRLVEEAKKLEKQAKKRDYYKILDLKRDANENEIRKAYKKLALKWHPDRNNESEEQKKMAEKTFRDINDAYSVLSDPKKKQQYDAGMDPLNPEEAQGMDGGMHFSGADFDMGDIFKMFTSGGGQCKCFFNI